MDVTLSVLYIMNAQHIVWYFVSDLLKKPCNMWNDLYIYGN